MKFTIKGLKALISGDTFCKVYDDSGYLCGLPAKYLTLFFADRQIKSIKYFKHFELACDTIDIYI